MPGDATSIPESDITQLLHRAAEGDLAARDRLLPLLYERLRQQARWARRRERHLDTLSTTALVHEMYLDVFGDRMPQFPDRQKFFNYAARAMQHLLTDHARHHLAHKRGCGKPEEPLENLHIRDDDAALQLIAMDQAICFLQDEHPRMAEVVRLKFFVGLSEQEIANLLEVDARTVRRDWQKARAHVLLQLDITTE